MNAEPNIAETNTDTTNMRAGTGRAFFGAHGSDQWLPLGDEVVTYSDTDDFVATPSEVSRCERNRVAPVTSASGTVDISDNAGFQAFLHSMVMAQSQSNLKRGHKSFRQANLAFKRANASELVGLVLVSEKAHPHGSRAQRRRAAHNVRKATNPKPTPNIAVKAKTSLQRDLKALSDAMNRRVSA